MLPREFARSSSIQTFVLLPALALVVELVRRRGRLRLDIRPVPLLLCGFLLYRLCGDYRLRHGGGGPGMDTPPERLVKGGPYALSRNPMYLGHLVFGLGVALTLRSKLAALIMAERWLRFSRRVERDEVRLAALFGKEYAEYCRRVPRWMPTPRLRDAPPSRSPAP